MVKNIRTYCIQIVIDRQQNMKKKKNVNDDIVTYVIEILFQSNRQDEHMTVKKTMLKPSLFETIKY